LPAFARGLRRADGLARRSFSGSVALVNVKTDDRARAGTVAFAQYAT
jgi:hypothetical protein